MALVSQNPMRKSKFKREKNHEPSFLGSDSDSEDGKESELGKLRNKRRKEEVAVIDQERESKRLEALLFGASLPIDSLEEDEEDAALFFEDRTANNKTLVTHERDKEADNQRKPVWVDEEEEDMKINIAKVNKLRKLRKEEDETVISGLDYVSRLRAQHAKLNRCTEWAKPGSAARDSDDDDSSSDEENGAKLARNYENVPTLNDHMRMNEDWIVKSSGKLMPGLLEYSRLVDANAQDPSKGVINSVEFHRNGQLLLTAGLDRRLRFFQVDGKRNTKIQSIFLDDCPIHKASFVPDGSQVIVSGRRRFFYTFDLVKARVDKIGPLVGREEKSLESFEVSPDSTTIAFVGNEGYILLVSTKTKELIGTLKMNGTVRSMAFSGDGKTLLTSGGDGEIYHWDLRTRTCLHKGTDEGCLNGTALSVSPNGSFFAAGSESGIVNVYNNDEFLGGNRKPVKTIENLTTRVGFMKFNGDAQILAICSNMQKNSLKLVHVPTFRVFSNWPPVNRAMQYPRCIDFSPGGGFMAVGNAAGNVLLYKLHHYNHA